ncbi:MAG: hypothetical protein ACNA8W_25710 [Bradymonadaceae bacterium]
MMKNDTNLELLRAMRDATLLTGEMYFFDRIEDGDAGDEGDAKICALTPACAVQPRENCEVIGHAMLEERVVMVHLDQAMKHHVLVSLIEETRGWVVVTYTGIIEEQQSDRRAS